MDEYTCKNCLQELDYLDTILHKPTRASYELYICHNEDCEWYGTIYNNKNGLSTGDPSGCY